MLRFVAAFLVTSLIILQACAPAPRRTLSAEEKVADLYWLYSQYSQNYAPLEYKEERFGFNFEELKAEYLERAKQTRTNEEFYALLHQFVAEFQDAHNSGTLFDIGFPGRHQIAYLGFSGKRVGKALQITGLLPTIKSDSHYPLKLKDKILKINGVELAEAVKRDVTPYRSLGQEESTLTYGMNKLFNRMSLQFPLPTEKDVTLTVLRGEKEIEITLPWVVKDLYQFTQEQKQAEKTTQSETSDDEKKTDEEKETDEEKKSELSELARIFGLGFEILSGDLQALAALFSDTIRGTDGYSFWNSFRFVDMSPGWESTAVAETVEEAYRLLQGGNPKLMAATPAERLAKERKVPANVSFIAQAGVYPTYMRREQLKDKDGNVTKSKVVAYMRLDTFSPTTMFLEGGKVVELDPVKELKNTLEVLESFGVTDLVIDTIDNGGGSLLLGMALAQALSNEKVVMPGIQFKVSETWVNEFQSASRKTGSDIEQEVARRVFMDLEGELMKPSEVRAQLSPVYALETLAPYRFEPNSKLDRKFNIVLLVNEMCASMCDIFAGILQDNGLATVVGARTMGAGGNVVNSAPQSAPNSHFVVSRTESLIVRPNGQYIENNGITPDVELVVNEKVTEKYDSIRTSAVELLLGAEVSTVKK